MVKISTWWRHGGTLVHIIYCQNTYFSFCWMKGSGITLDLIMKVNESKLIILAICLILSSLLIRGLKGPGTKYVICRKDLDTSSLIGWGKFGTWQVESIIEHDNWYQLVVIFWSANMIWPWMPCWLVMLIFYVWLTCIGDCCC